MCYDNIEEISAAVEAVRKAKELLEAFEADVIENDALMLQKEEFYCIDITFSEARMVITRRLETATARLNELVKPVVRVNEGDRARELAASQAALASRTGLPSQEGGA
jgi:hypothetical protein